MVVPAQNELYIRVRLDGTSAKKEMDKVGMEATKMARVLPRILAATLGYFYGGIAQEAGAAMQQFGTAAGLSSPLGQNAAQFWRKFGAEATATERTVEMFGYAGAKADKGQVLQAYHVFREMEQLRAASKTNVESIIGEYRVDASLKEAIISGSYATRNIWSVLKELGNYVPRFR